MRNFQDIFETRKRSVISTFSICMTVTLISDLSKFQTKFLKLQRILSKNVYPQKYVDKCISKFLNKIFEHKPKVTKVPTKSYKGSKQGTHNFTSLFRKYADDYEN